MEAPVSPNAARIGLPISPPKKPPLVSSIPLLYANFICSKNLNVGLIEKISITALTKTTTLLIPTILPLLSLILFKAHKIFQKHDIKEDRVLRKFRAFYINRFKFNDCSAVGAQQLAISPNGNISICHAYWNNSIQKCGNINSCNFEDVFRTKTYKNWKHNLTVNKKQCLKCPAIYICGGGCPKQAADMFNNINGIDKPFCIHTKHSLKELLKELINKPTS